MDLGQLCHEPAEAMQIGNGVDILWYWSLVSGTGSVNEEVVWGFNGFRIAQATGMYPV